MAPDAEWTSGNSWAAGSGGGGGGSGWSNTGGWTRRPVERIRGRVKDWNAVRGVGFVSCLDADYFCHFSSIAGEERKSLKDGEEIEFEVEVNASNGKLHAVNITGPDGTPLKGSDVQAPGKSSKGKGAFGHGYRNNGYAKGKSGSGKGSTARPNTVFVAGLSYSTDSDGLREHFEQAGEVVDAYVAMDRDAGSSRGFGKVSFATAEGHQQAVELLNGSELDGRTVSVRENNPDAPRASARNAGGASSGKSSAGAGSKGGPRANCVFVAGLAYATTSEALHEHFSSAGEVLDAYVVMDRDTGRSRGFGKVTFAMAEGQMRAVEQLHESEIDGRNISVREDNPDAPRSAGKGGAKAGASAWLPEAASEPAAQLRPAEIPQKETEPAAELQIAETLRQETEPAAELHPEATVTHLHEMQATLEVAGKGELLKEEGSLSKAWEDSSWTGTGSWDGSGKKWSNWSTAWSGGWGAGGWDTNGAGDGTMEKSADDG